MVSEPAAERPNPLSISPLASRDDVVEAARVVCSSALSLMSAAGARRARGRDLGRDGTPIKVSAHLEAFARPLWALAPLLANGEAGEFAPRVRAGLAAGTDPSHPEYWGSPGRLDQRLVEQGTIGAALLIAADELWVPLTEDMQRSLRSWLAQGDGCRAHVNNWQFLRLLVDLARLRLGDEIDWSRHRRTLRRVEARAVADGWYDDRTMRREPPRCDWYSAFTYQVYGLLYAWSGLGDPQSAQRFRERAAAFAPQLRRWFAPDGAAIAYGRSMTYRWAQAAFWGLLAAAEVDVLPWDEVKGLYLRNLRHWGGFDAYDDAGDLTVGYRGSHAGLAEGYISVASPLWACKGFLGLLVPAEHPFWRGPEAECEVLAGPVAQPGPGFVLSQDRAQALAVGGRQWAPNFVSQGIAKYERLAYSSLLPPIADAEGVSDSTLSVVVDNGTRLVRSRARKVAIEDEVVVSAWRPSRHVEVHTAVWGAAPWHLRAHVVHAERAVTVEEWAFAVDALHDQCGDGSALAWGSRGHSAIVDLSGGRAASTVAVPSAAAIFGPATLVPMLTARLAAGHHVLVTAVYGGDDGQQQQSWPDEVTRVLQVLERHGGRRPTRMLTQLVGRAGSPGRTPAPCWVGGRRPPR